jgi:WhiB family redox-sensing transcriptional regulator
LTERERRAILRKRPNVSSWRALLETAQRDHAALQARAHATALAVARRSA